MSKRIKTTAVFDIGKTNKKFFLFDEGYQQVYRDYVRFDEIKDEDGHPTDDLTAIRKWLRSLLDEMLRSKEFDVRAINFSTYGASLVHLDKKGQPLTPLYNYTKPIPEEVIEKFYTSYGGDQLAQKTASPRAGMLNSGIQLYWIKYYQPDIFQQIKYSLHFPQYLSYLFTGIPVSDFTSIGCHTSLWDYEKEDYHNWVYQEGIDQKLAPIVSTETSINQRFENGLVKVGVGIHDSSAALLPYLLGDRKPFLLVSTGTWSIALNPFNHKLLEQEELQKDCLNYMRINGKSVRAARLFIGNEYKLQTKLLHKHFDKAYGYHRQITFSENYYNRITENFSPKFHFESIGTSRIQPSSSQLVEFDNFEHAYHQLMIELMELQIQSAHLALGDTKVRRIYIDGGFVDNDVFVKLCTHHLKDYKLRTTQSPLGSALGAAMVISGKNLKGNFLKKNYALKKHKPLILSE